MTFRTGGILGGLLVAMAMVRPLGAQARSALEIGVTAVRFIDDSTTVAGPSLRVAEQRQRGGWSGGVDAGGVATSGAFAGSASIAGSWRAALGGRFGTELGGDLGSVVGSSSRASTTAVGAARLLWATEGAGASVRATSHVAGRAAGTLWGHGVGASAWRQWPRSVASVRLGHEWSVAQLFRDRYHRGLLGTVPVSYTEGALAMHLEGNASTLDVEAGARHDPDASRTMEPTLALAAAYWQSPTRAWTVSLARQPADFVRGGDAVRAVSLGLRFREPTPASARAERLRPVLELRATDGEGTLVRVRASGASRVEIMADFTGWMAVELTETGKAFERAMSVSRGSHRAVVRVDGGAWKPAANTPAVDDDLGGKVGLVVAP